MKKKIIIVLICFLLFILDNSLMPFLAIKGVYPSLLFSFALSYAIIYEKWEALTIGVFTGLLQDIYFTNAFGINLLTNMLMCIVASNVGALIYKDKSIIPIITNFSLSLVKGVLVVILLFIINQKTDNTLIVYRSVYTGMVAVFMYNFIFKLSQKNFMTKDWNIKKRGF
ncbi:rod shape-determining protein MreD [Clostridium grantii]|uniref:Rod shape-determining protein MreD n=1 Tax=Clostridium grantii DSM 8605 TaxID=1121316 RepID=A0A1M5X3A3_9CLOT|nr:rod shape-determining protein MreD [Clostridium grantii]SHH94317.1 rod shape-determining protein MreD [Clostridium grantii DSM 8605]